MRRIAALLAALLLAFVAAPPAFAIDPPVIDPAAVPPDETGPDSPTEPSRECTGPITFPDSNFVDKPWANSYLRLAEAQKFATGAGVTVAVIDTGVNGSPRVPAEPGGDFIDQGGNGMSDWIANRGMTGLLQRTVVVLNDSDGHADKRTRSILAQQFAGQGQAVVEVPFDGHLRPGGVIDGTSGMSPEARRRFVEIAAALAEHFPTHDDRARERR